jgi:hypothetical protein
MSARPHDWLAELRGALVRGAADGVLSFGPPRRREQVLIAAERHTMCRGWNSDLTWLRYLRGRRRGRGGRNRTSAPVTAVEQSQSGG